MRRRTLLSSSGGFDPTTGRKMIGKYEVVDLGLSNGLLFATCNVLASIETYYGAYYMYGKGSRTYNSSDSIYKGTENPLASTADTATQVMGEGWRMPTEDELRDLINKTDYEFVTINGMSGGKFTSKTNPNAYVFFPAAGQITNGTYYNWNTTSVVWSSTPNISNSAYNLWLNNEVKIVSSAGRGIGYCVRGVHARV